MGESDKLYTDMDWWQKLHHKIGNTLIGATDEMQERSGVPISWDFYLPRSTVHLRPIQPNELTPRVAENDFRRKLSKSVAHVCTVISIVFVNASLFGFPALVGQAASLYNKATYEVSRFSSNLSTNGLKSIQITNPCTLKENTLECRNHLVKESSEAHKRTEKSLEWIPKSKLDLVNALMDAVVEESHGASQMNGKQSQALAQRIASLEAEIGFTNIQLIDFRNSVKDEFELGSRIKKISTALQASTSDQVKTKSNDVEAKHTEATALYEKAMKTGLSSEETARYNQLKQELNK